MCSRDLRDCDLQNLIAAEDIASAVRGEVDATSVELRDDDHDGLAELHVMAPGQALSITPVDGGGLSRWDVRAARHALYTEVSKGDRAPMS